MNLDSRVRRLEQGQRASRPVDLAWREEVFDYEGYGECFEELLAEFTVEEREAFEESAAAYLQLEGAACLR